MNQATTNQTHNCYECGSETTLYEFPHQYAGIYECQNDDCRASFNCEHDSYMIDRDLDIAICDACGVSLECDREDF